MEISILQKKIEDSLKKEISLIFNRKAEPVEKFTILGSDINKIRHIFYYLKSQKVPIKVDYQMDTFWGYISDVQDLVAVIEIKNFEESSFRRIVISFNFLNVFYSFEVSLQKVEKELVYITLPTNIQYSFRRKYPRIEISDSFARIQILYQNLFSEKEMELIFTQNYGILKNEIEKEYPSLDIIIRIIISNLNQISNFFSFTLYYEFKKEKSRSWLENQLQAIKKTIFIENTDSLNSYYLNLNSTLITNFERTYKNMLKTQSEEDVIKYFERIQKEDIRNQKNSYIISPIFLFEKLFGYIYLETSYIERKRIFFSDAIQIAILARVLSYALEKILFHNKYYAEENIRILNLSLSGALLHLKSEVSYKYLIQNDFIKFETDILNTKISCISHITRMFTKKENDYYIAIHFLEYLEDSFSLLEKSIYNLNFKKRGFITPPTTEFRE